jgi:hypothetical protein
MFDLLNFSGAMSTRLRQTLHLLPVWLAAAIAAIEVLTYGGQYFPDTTQFVRHGPFVHDFVTSKPFFNVIPPAYPVVLGVIAWLAPSGARMFVLIVLQQASVVASTWFLLRIGAVLECPKVGWAAALMSALYVPLGLFAQSAQSETLAVFYMTASTYFLIRGIQCRSGRAALQAGTFGALCVAQRTPFAAVPIAAMIAVWIGRSTSRVRTTAIYTAAFVVVLFAFAAKNQWQFGTWRLVDGVGIHLFGRVAMLEKRGPDTPAMRMVLEVGKDAGFDNVFFENAGWALWWPLTLRAGGDPFAADAILRRAAIDAMTADPGHSLRLTIESMVGMARPLASVNWEHFWGGLHPETYEQFMKTAASSWMSQPGEYIRRYNSFPGYPPRAKLGTAPFEWMDRWITVTQLLCKGTWTLVLLALIGLWGLWRRHYVLILTSATCLGLLAAAAIGDQPVARYWEVALPMMFLAWCACAADLARSLRRVRLDAPRLVTFR